MFVLHASVVDVSTLSSLNGLLNFQILHVLMWKDTLRIYIQVQNMIYGVILWTDNINNKVNLIVVI